MKTREGDWETFADIKTHQKVYAVSALFTDDICINTPKYNWIDRKCILLHGNKKASSLFYHKKYC